MSNPDEIREDIERTRAELGQDVDALADKVSPAKIAGRQTRRLRAAAGSLKDHIMGSATDAVESTQAAVGHAGEVVANAPHQVAASTRGNPIAVGLIAFGVGLLAASLIPSTKVERDAAEQAKDAAGPLVDKVKEVAAETADHLREPAREAAEAVKERAGEAVDAVRDEAETAAGQVGGDARHAAAQQPGAATDRPMEV